jgi:hypothetical protein
MASSARSACARVPIRFLCTLTYTPFHSNHSSDRVRRS